MKKRLLSLALCLAMLLPTLLLFTSCQEEEVEATGTIAPMTVVIALMTDEKTNDAGVEAAEKALNRITENNFNTHVELKLFTEAEYYTKVEEALVARRQAIINGDKSTSVGDVKDKILITKMTDPGWVFLLTQAKGVISEKGSLLSHTAIISREIGIPSIVGVKDLMLTIQSGDLIRMNGDKGKIEILKRSGDT